MPTHRTLVEAICEGSPREMGFAQGAAVRSKVRAAREALADLEAFRLQQPCWLPYSVYRWIAEQKASRFLSAPLACDYPAMNCSSVNQAADFISSMPRWGGALLMLADANGDIASLELSSTRQYLRRPAEGEDLLFHTNAFSSPQMREVQIASDAVYTTSAPTPLRGRRLHQSSELRDRRFQQLLAKTDIFDVHRLSAIMADHGSDGTPGDDTLCVHGSYWFTTACLQFFPRSRRIRVAYSTACQARFEDVEL